MVSLLFVFSGVGIEPRLVNLPAIVVQAFAVPGTTGPSLDKRVN